MISDKLAQKLRKAGFKGRWKPTLSEMIETFKDYNLHLRINHKVGIAQCQKLGSGDKIIEVKGKKILPAVVRLFLKVNKKK